jgi:hypothetical protein
VRAALLEHPDGRGERLLGGRLVGAERQVGDDQRPPGRRRDRADGRDELVDGDRPCIVFPMESPISSMSMPASSKIRAVG